jgi:hypothetical protein
VGLVGRLALTAFTAGGMDLAMAGGVLDEQGNVDWDQIFRSAVEGGTSVTEVPVAGKMLDLIKGSAGKTLFRRFINTGGGALLEGIEEPFQQFLSTAIGEGRIADLGELKVAATLGSILGGGMTGTMAAFQRDGGDTKAGNKLLDQALDWIRENDPDLLDENFQGTLTQAELQERIADAMPEVQQALAEAEAADAGRSGAELDPVTDEQMLEDFQAYAAEQAGVDPEAVEAAIDQESQRLEEQEAAEAKAAEQRAQTKPKKMKDAETGDLVEAPEPFAPFTQKAKWRKAGDNHWQTSVDGQILDVQLGNEGLVMKAADAQKAGYDTDTDLVMSGEFTPDAEVRMGRGDLIKLATGQGRTTAAHEFLHFMFKNGFVSKKNQATLATRYAKEIRAYAKDNYGITNWSRLSKAKKALYTEEGIAEVLGNYAASKYGESGLWARVPKPLRDLNETVRGLLMKVTGKTDAELDELLAGEYAKGADRAEAVVEHRASRAAVESEGGTRARLDTTFLPGKGRTPTGAVPISVSSPGWQGIRNPKTGTIGLQGPNAEKIGTKIDGKTLAVKTIGKGTAESSRGVVQAMRDFARQRKLDRIVMTSKPGEITPAAYEWRDRMVARGDARYTADGEFEVAVEPGAFGKTAVPRSLARIDAVATRRKRKGETPRRNKKQVVAFLNENAEDLSGMDEKQRIEYVAKNLAKEIRYQQKQVKSGAGWYRGDIRELEHAAQKAFPELKDPQMMGLFKVLAAATSFGNRPNPNMEQAFEIWKGFRESFEEFPGQQTAVAEEDIYGDMKDEEGNVVLGKDGKPKRVLITPKGKPKEWAGSPVFGVTAEKLKSMKKELGSWEAVVAYMMSQHDISDIRRFRPTAEGKATDKQWGSYALGPKGNSFFQNLVGNLGELTADVWWTRTYNRAMGLDVSPEAPRNGAEREMMRKVIDRVAARTGVSRADAQAMLWFAEQDLWTRLGLKSESGSYAVAGRRALESQRAGKAASKELVSPSAVKPSSVTVAVEVAFGPNSPIRQKYDWDALTPAQARQVTDRVLDRLLPAIESDTGVTIEQDVRGRATTKEWGKNPNAVVRVSGTPGQVRQAAMLLALGLQQDSVVVSRPDPDGTPTPFVRVLGGVDLTDAKVLDDIWARLEENLGGIGMDSGIDGMAADVAPNLTPMLKLFGAGPAADVKRYQAALRKAVLAAAPGADIRAGSNTFDADFIGNDWTKYPKGEEVRNALDDEGYSPDFVDDFVARSETEIDAAYKDATTAKGEAALLPGKRARRAVGSSFGDTWRRMTKPLLTRLREIKAHGRPVGERLATAVEQRQEYMEHKLSRLSHGWKKALRGFKKAEGDNWQASWDAVARALDGQEGHSYAKLTDTQKKLYLVGRAIFNTAKTDAIENGVFTGQIIHKYFPHFRTDQDEIDPVQDHLDWLLENNPDKLDELRGEDAEWMAGLMGEASDYELAAKDIGRNWKNEKWWKANPHLEKHRGPEPGTYRMDPDVVMDYINGVYPRIATARFFGQKSEVVDNAMRSLRSSDPDTREFVYDALQTTLGFGQKQRSLVGRGFDQAMKELSALSGIVKLANAAFPQLTQIAVAKSEAMGPGTVRGLKNIVNALRNLRHWEAAGDSAVRAGSTFAAEGLGASEIMKAQYGLGAGTYTEKAFKKIFSLGGLFKPGEKIVSSSWGVIPLDKAARVVADSIGREVYLDALERGDVETLTDLLGSPEAARQAIKKDQAFVGDIRQRLRDGRLDETRFEPRMARPAEGDPHYVGKNLGWRRGVERMDKAAKRFADKTQYRTRAQDAPVGFQAPLVRWANTFLSFMYQHWRWNVNHTKAFTKAMSEGNTERAKRAARVLMTQHLIMAPIYGQIAFTMRAWAAGRGAGEEDEIEGPLEALDAVMGIDPIKATDKWTTALRALQGWQYAGGIGYPATLLERWRRGSTRENTARGLVSAVAGAPGESVFDAGQLALEISKYVNKAVDGRATNADRKRLGRALATMTNHVVPNPGGISGGLRREVMATERYPNDSPGWLGFLWDAEAEWNAMEGVTSPTYREREREGKEARAEKKERERERAEEERLEAAEGF